MQGRSSQSWGMLQKRRMKPSDGEWWRSGRGLHDQQKKARTQANARATPASWAPWRADLRTPGSGTVGWVDHGLGYFPALPGSDSEVF